MCVWLGRRRAQPAAHCVIIHTQFSWQACRCDIFCVARGRPPCCDDGHGRGQCCGCQNMRTVGVWQNNPAAQGRRLMSAAAGGTTASGLVDVRKNFCQTWGFGSPGVQSTRQAAEGRPYMAAPCAPSRQLCLGLARCGNSSRRVAICLHLHDIIAAKNKPIKPVLVVQPTSWDRHCMRNDEARTGAILPGVPPY